MDKRTLTLSQQKEVVTQQSEQKTQTSRRSNPEVTVRIRPTFRRGGTLLINMPIGARLTLSFLIAALIATTVAGTLGILRAQSLTKQSDFYASLLKTNTKLSTGAQFLQQMNAETRNILTVVTSAQPSAETLNQDQQNMKTLMDGYDSILNDYSTHDLLKKHPDQISIIQEAGRTDQPHLQETLAASALRTWQVQHSALQQFLQDISDGHISQAQLLNQVQIEPTNADASSALRSLILFNNKLASSIQKAATVEEQNQFFLTIASSVITFLTILLIGWLISGTIVRRLRSLRQVTLSVEQGELSRRVNVIGRDEIADVSAAVNAMLDAIVNLVEETRQQRDTLTNAAENLFSDMRVVSAGDLRINASTGNDPIGMLANAFNLTVGRFRRFVLRARTVAEQLDVLAHQELERAEGFTQSLSTSKEKGSASKASGISSEPLPLDTNVLVTHLQNTRDHVQNILKADIEQHTRKLFLINEQANNVLKKLYYLSSNNGNLMSQQSSAAAQPQHDLQALRHALKQIAQELYSLQQRTNMDLQQVDTKMEEFTNLLRTRSSSLAQPVAGQESKQDLSRQSSVFANDITTVARQLIELAQEMRNSTIPFQLDAAEVALVQAQAQNLKKRSSTSLSGSAPLTPPPSQPLSFASQQPSPLIPRPSYIAEGKLAKTNSEANFQLPGSAFPASINIPLSSSGITPLLSEPEKTMPTPQRDQKSLW